MNPVQDDRKPQCAEPKQGQPLTSYTACARTATSADTPSQTKRLEKRFAYLAGGQAGSSPTITKATFCCQPEVSTNVFVGAYIDRLLEKKLPRGREDDGDENSAGEGKRDEPERICDALNFEVFVHLFWAFSSSAPRSEKEEVLRTLLQPDDAGLVDRRSMFRFVKCMLPSAPDRALEGVVDGFIDTLGAEKKGEAKQSRRGREENCVSIQAFLEQRDYIDRLTFRM